MTGPEEPRTLASAARRRRGAGALLAVVAFPLPPPLGAAGCETDTQDTTTDTPGSRWGTVCPSASTIRTPMESCFPGRATRAAAADPAAPVAAAAPEMTTAEGPEAEMSP